MSEGYEWGLLKDYLARSREELAFDAVVGRDYSASALVLVEGFEERSVGIIEKLAQMKIGFRDVFLGRYPPSDSANGRYHHRAIAAAKILTPNPPIEVEIDGSGKWISGALRGGNYKSVLLDITGLSTRALFGTLDSVTAASKTVTIAYSEALQYWPKKDDWQKLQPSLVDFKTLADVADDAPWLFGHEHSVELLDNHEGYDSPAASSLLIAFLPYKRARLAAIVTNHDYERFVFIAGRPRLELNQWRLDALIEINKSVVKTWPLVEMSTFGYRQSLIKLFELTMSDESNLLQRHNVHLGLLGSKLQDVGCWVFSKLVPSVAVLTSVPNMYYPNSFSDGIGRQWMFDFVDPIILA